MLGPLTGRLRAAAKSVNSTQSALNKSNNEAQAAISAVEARVAQAQADVTAKIFALGNYTNTVRRTMPSMHIRLKQRARACRSAAHPPL